MIFPRGSLRPPGRRLSPLTELRDRLLQIDGELLRAADPDPWLDRAAALARRADPDPEHGTRVAALAARLARALGWPAASAEQLRRAAQLHETAKFALPRALLLDAGPHSAPASASSSSCTPTRRDGSWTASSTRRSGSRAWSGAATTSAGTAGGTPTGRRARPFPSPRGSSPPATCGTP